MGTKVIQNSLNAGELGPGLDARTDLAKYYNGATVMSNAIALPQGGAIKRPGGEWIAKAKGPCCLLPFSFSATDSMIIEAGDEYMRFFKDSDRVMCDSVSIVGITLVSGNPVSIEATTHLLTTGDLVRFTGVVGTHQLNYLGLNNEYTVTRTDADNFTLDGTDSDDFDAWSSGGSVAAVYEITTPWSETEVYDIHITPVADVVRIVHEDYLPRKLSRIADNSWTIETIEPSTGPFLDANTTTTKTLEINKYHSGTHTEVGSSTTMMSDVNARFEWVTNSLDGLTIYNVTDGTSATITENDTSNILMSAADGVTWDTDDVYYIDSKYYIRAGTIGLTLTAVGHTPFVAAHVGAYFVLNHTRDDNTSTLNAIGTSDAVRTKGAFTLSTSEYTTNAIVDLQRKAGDGDWQSFRKFSSATSYAGTEPEDDVFYRTVITVANATAEFVAQDQMHRSIVKATAYVSSTTMTVTAVTDIYFNYEDADNKTSDWAEGAWSAVRYYPRACTLHEGRMWYAATTTSPQTLWSSKSSEYDDFTRSANLYDNEAVVLELDGPDVSQIEWIASFGKLFVGTAKTEYMLEANDPNDPITPTDRRAKIQSSYGSSHIQPVVLDNGILFAQRNGLKTRFVTLNQYGDRQITTDVNRLAEHVFISPPTGFSVQTVPYTQVWAAREDGQAAVLVWNPDEEVLSWSRCVTGGVVDYPTEQYKSFATIPGTNEDQVWYSVLRRINGTLVTYIEKFSARNATEIDEYLMLDAAKVVESSYDKIDIVVVSDTIRYGSGLYGSGPYGGMI